MFGDTKAAPWDKAICDKQGQLGWPLQPHVSAAGSKEKGHGRSNGGKKVFSGYLLAVVILVEKEGRGKDKKCENFHTLPTI